jgi:hypothetical protein
VESTPSYKIHHAVTSEKPRNDIVIEEASSDDRETFKDDREERISDFKETADRHTSTKKVSLWSSAKYNSPLHKSCADPLQLFDITIMQ